MKLTTRLSMLALEALIVSLALAACVASAGYYGPDPGYDTDVAVGVGVGYVEPYGYAVGGWGGGYRVGPGRGGDRRGDGGSHAYRSAPQGRAAPSIPRGSRGGAPDKHR